MTNFILLFHVKSYPLTSLSWGKRDRKVKTADIKLRVVAMKKNHSAEASPFNIKDGMNKASFKKENSDKRTKYLTMELICKEDKSSVLSDTQLTTLNKD